MIKFKVTDEDVGKRIDSFLAAKLPELSRSFIKKLDSEGKVTVNGEVEKTSYKLRAKDKVALDYKLEQLDEIPDIDLPILYEDDDCIVMNKPVGVLTHSKGAFNPEPTVATFINNKVKVPKSDRAGIVHRLDRATSGVIIAAKNPEALSWLQKQFSQRRTKKTYIAVIEGHLDPEKALIDMPIERNPKKPQTFRVGQNGKPAQTTYEVIKSSDKYSMLQLQPTTGRTHQLRVHLKQLGHPIVGDTLYGMKPAQRLFLHALSLEITLPNRTRQIFKASLPAVFNKLMKD
jgi:23S rRNA pseudouridine1911/1915/1917 synthase